jgi:hypothetical protein
MLDRAKPYHIYYIQKSAPTASQDDFSFSYIYRFYTEKTDNYQRLKYIIRAECIEDVFAIKFYAARDRKHDKKYNRIIKAHGYINTLRVFFTCASIVPLILEKHPMCSFVINGAQSMDLKSKIEDRNNNQRFRIYKNIAIRLFGKHCFEHYEFKEISSYLIINKKDCLNIEEKKERIKKTFLDIYNIDM